MKVIYCGCHEPVIQMALKRSQNIRHAGFSASEISEESGIPLRSVIETLCLLQERDICTRCADDWTVPVTGSEQWVLIEHALTLGKEYEVLGIEAENYRVLNFLRSTTTRTRRQDSSFGKILPHCIHMFSQIKHDA